MSQSASYVQLLHEMSEQEKILIILDLDETLIYATKNPKSKDWDYILLDYMVWVRPYLNEFLYYLKENFKIAVWSSASQIFVEEIINKVFPKDIELEFLWNRDNCTFKPNLKMIDSVGYFDVYSHHDYIKPLKKVRKKFTFKKEKILIIDDTPRKSIYNYGNAIYPSEFYGNRDDNELKFLIKYLEKIKNVENVRTIEKRNWRNEVKS